MYHREGDGGLHPLDPHPPSTHRLPSAQSSDDPFEEREEKWVHLIYHQSAESTAATAEVTISSRSPHSCKQRRRISSTLQAPVVQEDPAPVVPSQVVLEDLTPLVPSKVVLEDPTPVVSEVTTELPDFTAATIKKAIFAFYLMAVLHAWVASESTPGPASVREPSKPTHEPTPAQEPSESTQEPAPVWEPSESSHEPAPVQVHSESTPEPALVWEPSGPAPVPPEVAVSAAEPPEAVASTLASLKWWFSSPPGPALASCSASSTLVTCFATVYRPFFISTGLNHHLSPCSASIILLDSCFVPRTVEHLESLERGFCHSLQLVCPRWPPENTVWLCRHMACVVCLCLVLFPVYCLILPSLLPHYFSDSTCVSLITYPNLYSCIGPMP